jgi:YD repeat-containing protein
MHLLNRICIQNWYLVDAIDIEIDHSSGLLGPTGAGKSSIADAIQAVLTGGNTNRLNLNPSASGKSARSILDYCLGMTGDPAEGGEPLRKSCETVIALVFRDEETAEPITIGMAFSARQGDSREEVLSRFIVPGYAYSVGEAKRRSGASETLAPWSEIAVHLRRMSPDFEEYRTSAEKFTTDFLKRMRGRDAQAPNARHFLRAYTNALAFKPIFDPTQFVRDYVLEPDMLDIERVRSSMDTWKELERVIEQIESKLRRLVKLEQRFGSWGGARLKSGETKFIAAHAEMRRAAHEFKLASEAFVSRRDELARKQQFLATQRQWVAELDDEIRSKRVLADAGSAGARMRHLETEKRLEDREAAAKDERLRKVRLALGQIAILAPVEKHMTPRHRRAVDAAIEAMRMIPEGMNAAQALHGKGEKLQHLIDEVVAAGGLHDLLNEKADQMSDSVRQLQARVEQIETVLGQGGSERAILSGYATKLMSALDREGMDPIALCDVVDIVDPSWQEALESLLGRNREAIIVEPRFVRDAHELMYRNRDVFWGCTLVRTNSPTAARTGFPKGSILEAVRSDNHHALGFMNDLIGGFLKAETEAELDQLHRGVMRNGKTISGMRLTVQGKIGNLMLGKASRKTSGEALRNELAPLVAELNGLRIEMKLVRDAARIIPTALDVIAAGESVFDLEYSAKSTQASIERLVKDMRGGELGESAEILSEIADLERDRAMYIKEIAEETQPAVDDLLRDTAKAEAKAGVARDGLRKAVRDRSKAWSTLATPEMASIAALKAADSDALAILRRTRTSIADAEFERADIRAHLVTVRNDSRVLADQADRDAQREQGGAIREITEYSANWDIDVPRIDGGSMIEGYKWVANERQRLEDNELRQHRDACANAAVEMRKMLKEDLLARLSEKLSKIPSKMEALNQLLSHHKFTGQTYSFKWDLNGRFRKMHDLAVSVGRPDSDGTGMFDEALNEALVELEDLIEGKDGAATLADYRQYFVYDIIMTDPRGGRTTMSSRAVRGSGGEAQAPFYVVFAASLASAYYPGHSEGRPKGMGLAMFDEAFNKLDVPNTQALVTFFKAMGLQLMIAGPEDKRATYTEVLDTIILVNKGPGGDTVYIDAEHPGRKAKAALAGINPDHLGVDHFRTGTTG